jgi:molybdenum cofactor biosynthesis protein B
VSPHGDRHDAGRAAEAASVVEHRRRAPAQLPVAVITVSDTRGASEDTGGALLAELLEAAGHRVVSRARVRDDVDAIRAAVGEALAREEVRAVLLTGGTGLAPRDVTPEALRPLLEREIPGFGELFRALSFAEIGAAAMLSRALAGIVRGRLVVGLPGSRAAIRLALEKLLLPELGHLVGQADARS